MLFTSFKNLSKYNHHNREQAKHNEDDFCFLFSFRIITTTHLYHSFQSQIFWVEEKKTPATAPYYRLQP